ncbi:hypothetical protein GGR54DRAFT_66254 [Hypoxylon sp. NC1633]|nr:hypothetical protein GGR54DRAFT_66254 [Hypoxylon sp. NC1633]
MGAIKDDDGDPPANPTAAQYHQHRLSTARSSRSYGSYETGEASNAASFDGPSAGATTWAHSRIDPDESSSIPHTHTQNQGIRDLNHEVQRRRRSHRPRSSGGFLLANLVLDESSKSTPVSRDDGRRRSRIPVDSRKGKTPLNKSDRSHATDSTQTGLGIDVQDTKRQSDGQASRVISVTSDEERHQSQGAQRSSMIPTLQPSTAPLDVDSAQIVNMALNLSESRRAAAKRNISSPIPPRLAQLPDTPAGGSLKQHLQQQRRTSRNISPRPEKSLTPRAVSASRVASPLQPSFEQEGSYKYHFSSSTLNRAQKAKEYLELMAQYRRLLQFVPPIEHVSRSRPSSSGVSTSPTNAKMPPNPFPNQPQALVGQTYNPLQYIRNRKVRARERRTIDGEAQGFSDVSRVTDWIDKTSTSAAQSALTPGSYSLPLFSGALDKLDQETVPSNIPRPVSASVKPKRLRIDWSIDPADMLADAYWVEQGDNRSLIEDRHYSKIYPRKPETQVPTSQQAIEPGLSAVSTSSTKEGDAGDGATGSEADHTSPTRVESDVPVPSARDRARQKLQDLRGMHHKQNGLPHNHHDFLRFSKGSLSDTSDSETDRRRRNRNGTISANGTDLLEKQMMDMLAKEVSEEQKENLGDTGPGYLKQLPSRMATPEKTSRTPEQQTFSRRGSRVDFVESQGKVNRSRVLQASPIGSGRPSLEVPGHTSRLSTDLDSSRPESPDLKPFRGRSTQMPTIGMDLSPPTSRPGSPGRRPFSRVKSIFRDRSRERERERERERDRAGDQIIREKDDKADTPIEPHELLNLSALTAERFQSPDRRRSKSLTRKITPRSTNESHKSHRSMGSLKLRGEDQVGLRTIFKGGAKLDGMIRGGVSKVTDLLWKRDSDGEGTSSTSSSEESDEDVKRGRVKEPLTPSRSSSRPPRDTHRQKNYLDVMPPFKSASVSQDKPRLDELESLTLTTTMSRPNRSPRFDRLKPPRIDIRKASPPTTEFERAKSRPLRDSDVSDTESRPREPAAQVDKSRTMTSKDVSEVLPIPPSQALLSQQQPSTALSHGARHWSISNRGSESQGTQISRREVARLRALILCSGIKAMEISRRAHEPHPLFAFDDRAATDLGPPWIGPEMARFVPPGSSFAAGLSIPQTHVYPATARLLSSTITSSIQASESSTASFAAHTAPLLQRRVEALHERVAADLVQMTHRAADEADELSRDLVDGQRLRIKRVTDTMDKMLRRRRRRFRWVRRAGWLAVEWALVGFMWYVWFVVTVARVVLGLGRGVVGAVRWLLWL